MQYYRRNANHFFFLGCKDNKKNAKNRKKYIKKTLINGYF